MLSSVFCDILVFSEIKLDDTIPDKMYEHDDFHLTFILPKVELILSLFLVLPKNTDKNCLCLKKVLNIGIKMKEILNKIILFF